MDVIAALVPPLVVALAFVAIARVVLRHADGRRAAKVDDADGTGPESSGD